MARYAPCGSRPPQAGILAVLVLLFAAAVAGAGDVSSLKLAPNLVLSWDFADDEGETVIQFTAKHQNHTWLAVGLSPSGRPLDFSDAFICESGSIRGVEKKETQRVATCPCDVATEVTWVAPVANLPVTSHRSILIVFAVGGFDTPGSMELSVHQLFSHKMLPPLPSSASLPSLSPASLTTSSTSSAPPLRDATAPPTATLVRSDLVLIWEAGDNATLFTLVYAGTNWLAVSLDGGAHSVGCDPSSSSSSFLSLTSSLSIISPFATSASCVLLSGQISVSWSEALPSSVTGNVTVFVGSSPSLPSPSSFALTSLSSVVSSALSSPDPPFSLCSVALSDELTLEWSVVRSSLLWARLTLTGRQAWVGVGFSPLWYADVIGSDSVVGRFDVSPADAVLEYAIEGFLLDDVREFPIQSSAMQSLSYSSGDTVMSFLRPLDPGDSAKMALPVDDWTTILWAAGKYTPWEIHGSNGAKRVKLGACEVTDVGVAPSRVAHGVLMVCSWGFLLPLGVGVALLGRRVRPDAGPPAWWFTRHRALQISGVCLSVVGFGVAVSLPHPLGHFRSTHSRLGLVIFLCGLAQVGNAFIRPSPTAPKRWAWNILHKGLGYGAVLLSSPAIYLGAASLGVTAGVRFGVAYAVIFALATAAAAAAHCYARYRAAKGAAVSKSSVEMTDLWTRSRLPSTLKTHVNPLNNIKPTVVVPN